MVEIGKAVSDCVKTPSVSISQIASFRTLIGLSLLYSSAYYLPLVRPAGIYFLPSSDVYSLIVFPSLVTIAAVLIPYYLLRPAIDRWCSGAGSAIFAVFALSFLSVIAVKGLFSAADSDWRYVIPLRQSLVSPILLTTIQRIKFALCICVLLSVWALRGQLARVTRLLSSLGFAFAGLAMLRILLLFWNTAHTDIQSFAHAPLSDQISQQSTGKIEGITGSGGHDTHTPSRRVVWVIFDETDFNQSLFRDRGINVALSNFTRLAQHAVSATNANSPAGATIYSIPALLTGTAVAGSGIHLDDSATLSVERKDGPPVPFVEGNSIFGLMSARGESASILGFYHPYCRLFKVARCDSFPWPSVGGWAAALESNLPDAISSNGYWDSVTESEIRLLPEYLARDEDLTFIHLNFPHPPAAYADRLLHLTTSGDPLVEYSHNLLMADRTLGEIMEDLQKQSAKHDLLLVVSTDHWLRNRWFRANDPEKSRQIPFFAWRVGEVSGSIVQEPISTVHTAAMILDYLHGDITTQADIAVWLKQQSISPSFIPK